MVFLPHIIVLVLGWLIIKGILSAVTGNTATKKAVKKSNDTNNKNMEALIKQNQELINALKNKNDKNE
ncbi:MAG: hypothetical protein B6227_06050 [Fusobacteriia bacterium 4572_74]|nr:MAG: hypothetical protein B6227_06050 [Fusobacteriia bacterium 4572_74]